MPKALVVVESPAKAKTINKYLGRDYKVIASMGHVRDLPKSKLGVDVENGFEPDYESSRHAKKVIKELKERRQGGQRDLRRDRPGSRRARRSAGIWPKSWAARKKKIRRLMFNEITKKAILEAIKHPRRHRHEDGRRAAGAAGARPARRLQDQPDPLGQGAARAERRPRAVRRAEAHLRPRARDRARSCPKSTGTSSPGSPARCRRSSTRGWSRRTRRLPRSATRRRRSRSSPISSGADVVVSSVATKERQEERARRRSSRASCSRRRDFPSRRR